MLKYFILVHNSLIFWTILVSFVGVIFLSPVYADTSIIEMKIGERIFTSLDEIPSPSSDRKLQITYREDEGSAQFACTIFKIDEEKFVELNQLPSLANIAIVGEQKVGPVGCGTGPDGTFTYEEFLEAGFYAFRVQGTVGDDVTSDARVFIVALTQFEDGDGGDGTTPGGVSVDVNDFWRSCPTIDETQSPLNKIEYSITGKSDIKDLDIESNKINLEVSTNKRTNAISGELVSKSREDFDVQVVKTKCIYRIPETQGGSEIPVSGKLFSQDTLDAWNAPVPSCPAGNNWPEREITYFFDVTSGLHQLKSDKSKNVKFVITIDTTPEDKDDIEVNGDLFLGKDKETKISIVISSPPKVDCESETLV